MAFTKEWYKENRHPKGMLNRKHSLKSRKLMSLKGIGRKKTDITKAKMRLSKIGPKNPTWKGDDVGYAALHSWVRRNKPKPDLCEACNKNSPYDLANISGEYKRELLDWEWLCRKCHMISDNRMNNRDKNGKFKQGGQN